MKEFTIIKPLKRTSTITYFPSEIKAGQPCEHGQERGYKAEIEELLGIRQDCILVSANGDSMKDANIDSGDLIVIDPTVQPMNGDIVAARVDGEETLKYFYRQADGNRIELIPGNKNYKPIIVEASQTCDIIGVAMGVMRRLKRPGITRLGHIRSNHAKLRVLPTIGLAARKKFRDCILCPEKEDFILRKLHEQIDGKRGKAVALVILCAIELGYIRTPTYTEMTEEFPCIGGKSNFLSQLRLGWFSPADRENMMRQLAE